MNARLPALLGYLVAFAFVAASVLASPARAAEKPNILWLVAEDFGQHLGCYGTKEVATPNLDALAAGGMRFTRCFTTAPVCSPSRSALMTGMYATTIGAHNHRSNRKGSHLLPEGVRLVTDWMRDAGYFTANVVKLPTDLGFKGTGKTDWNFTAPDKPFDTNAWADLKAKQPFFAQINFQETHRTFHAPMRADPAKVELPPYYPDHPIVRADWARYLDAATELDRKIGLVFAQLEKDGLADNTVVFFFGDNGQAHVRGKQFAYDSGLLVPLLIRWPRGLPEPAGFAAGKVSDQLIAAIDLAPTALSLAGAQKPEKMQGRAFLGSLSEPRSLVFGAADRCDETVRRSRTVRDARYRYIRNFTPEAAIFAPNAYKAKQYPAWNLIQQLHVQGKLTPVQDALCAERMPDEELYDTLADPHEIENLATSANPEHLVALKRLRSELERWIEESNDQGRVAEASLPDKSNEPAASTDTTK
jgi:arylsulfatase A-like enzyme